MKIKTGDLLINTESKLILGKILKINEHGYEILSFRYPNLITPIGKNTQPPYKITTSAPEGYTIAGKEMEQDEGGKDEYV